MPIILKPITEMSNQEILTEMARRQETIEQFKRYINELETIVIPALERDQLLLRANLICCTN